MRDFDLYLDADGVICGFDQHVQKIFGKKVEAFQPKGSFWAALTHHDTHVEKFFRNLPKIDDADVLVDFVTAHFKSVKILTACGYTPKDAKEQKIAWFAEHYPQIECIVVAKSPDKAAYAHPYAILIDDRSKSIDPWVAKGGIGILHTSAEDTIAQLRAIVESVQAA